MDEPLKPGQWLHDMPDRWETVADVQELFRMVDEIKARLLADAIKKASLN